MPVEGLEVGVRGIEVSDHSMQVDAFGSVFIP